MKKIALMNSLTKVTGKIAEKKAKLICMLDGLAISFLMSPVGVYASSDAARKSTDESTDASADAKWNAVIDFITPWISRLGGVVILIGAVEFGLGFKNDDAEAKTKGMRTVIAGCIVVGVGVSSSTFLY